MSSIDFNHNSQYLNVDEKCPNLDISIPSVSSQPSLENIKWIFFDLDNTLFDFTANSAVCLRALYDNSELLSCLFPNYDDFADPYHVVNDSLWEKYHHGLITTEFLKRERFMAVIKPRAAEMGIEVADDFADQLNEYYLGRLGECSLAVEGAHDTLARLSQHYLIGVLSNGFNEVQYRKLKSMGLDRYVQRMVISDEIGCQKPDKRLFDHALAATGATADTALMIGDNADADIAGAVSAGWRAVWFNRNDAALYPDLDVITIHRLPDLLDLL